MSSAETDFENPLIRCLVEREHFSPDTETYCWPGPSWENEHLRTEMDLKKYEVSGETIFTKTGDALVPVRRKDGHENFLRIVNPDTRLTLYIVEPTNDPCRRRAYRILPQHVWLNPDAPHLPVVFALNKGRYASNPEAALKKAARMLQRAEKNVHRQIKELKTRRADP